MTDNPPANRTRYSIDALLDSGVQPFADLDEQEFAALRQGVGKRPLVVPVSITSGPDPILLDGHQRLRAARAAGRVFINADEARVVPGATRDNALEWSVQLNVQRRHLTIDQKADLARKLQAERHWSQRRIAKVFGVTQAAVSQWLAKHPDPDAVPVVIEGLDGKRYVTEPTPYREPSAPRSPWRPDGYAFKALTKARKLLESEPLAGLDAFYSAKLTAELEDTIAAAEAALNAVTGSD